MSSIFSDSTVSEEDTQQHEKLTTAYQLLLSNKQEEAIVLYKEIIQQNSRMWRAYQNLGVAYIITKKFQQAFQVLSIYVKHVPKDPLGHDSLGVSYSELNDPLQAICSFVNSININPNYYMSYYNLGVVLGKLNLNQMALNIYKKCIQLNPYYVNALNNIGDIYKKFDQVDTAIQHFKHVLQIDPEYSLAIKNLGNCYYSVKRYAQALIFYTKYLQFAQHEAVFLNLAVCYDHFNLYKQAAAYLVRAYNLSQNLSQRFDRCFLAGCLYFKQLHKISIKVRLLVQAGKPLTSRIADNFFLIYKSCFECFQNSNQIIPGYKETLQNIEKLKFNVFGYCLKAGGVYRDLINLNIGLQPSKPIEKIFYKQRLMIQKIKHWRKLTNKMITSRAWVKNKQKQSKKKQLKNKDLQEAENVNPGLSVNINSNENNGSINTNQLSQDNIEQYVYKIAGRKQIKSSRVKFIRKRYISRKFNHNFKRLLLKRANFVKKYNKFNIQVQTMFKLQKMSTTVTQPSEADTVNNDMNNTNNVVIDGQ